MLAALLIGLVFWVASIQTQEQVPANSRIVPDVTDMAYDRANEILGEEDLLAYRLDEPSTEVAEGNVIRTDPAAGTSVAPGQQVKVFVSAGQEMVVVPALEALGQDAARSALATAGLAVGAVTPRNDPDLAAGTSSRRIPPRAPRSPSERW